MKKLPSAQQTPSQPPPWQGEEQSATTLQDTKTCEVNSDDFHKNKTEVDSAPSPAKGRAGVGLGVGLAQTKSNPKKLNNPKQTKPNRQKLRKNPTQPEKLFWSWVRARQFGVKFRRQHGLGKYIVDFYCAELSLVVELDGDSHYTPEGITNDAVRSEFIKKHNIEIIRFTNQQIMQEKEAVLIALTETIRNRKQ